MANRVLAIVMLSLVGSPSVDNPDAAQLVTQLGSPTYAGRQAAGEALLTLGTAALPALRRAFDHADPEVRRRAERLVVQIEAGEILGATRIRLDIHDRPLAEAAEAIARVSGMTLKPGIDRRNYRAGAAWPERRVTLVAPAPVPFSQAIDMLCQAGGLQREAPTPGNDSSPFSAPFVMTLVPGKARPLACDTGALRVELGGVIVRREPDDRLYDPRSPRVQKKTTANPNLQEGDIDRSFSLAGLRVSAEPRLRILGVGPMEKLEAIDDQGRSLLKTPTAEEEERQLAHWQVNPHIDPRLHPGLRYGPEVRDSARARSVTIRLLCPAPPPRRIAFLRGVIPVAVVARRANPLEIALNKAASKEFADGPTRITVYECNGESHGGPTVELSVATGEAGAETMIMASDSTGVRLPVNAPLDLMHLRLDIVDSRGEPLAWEFTRPPTRRTQGRMAIVIYDKTLKKLRIDDLRLRYWTTVAAVTELPFVFKDVPVP